MAAEFERSDAGFEQPITERKITPSRVTEEQIIESAQTKLVLDKEFVKNLGSSVTPSVLNLKTFKADNIAPVTVTNLTDGQDGQPVRILGDGQTTMQHGAKIRTNIGADKLLLADMFYSFLKIDGIWYEQGA